MFASLLGFALALATASAPAGTDSVTVRQLQALYPAIFQVEEHRYEGGVAWSFDADTLPTGERLAPFVRDYHHYLLYLATHAPEESFTSLVSRKLSTAELRARVQAGLLRDTLFNALAMRAAAAYLGETGSRLAGPRPTVTPRIVRLDDVMRLAVRFFYPDAVLPSGMVQGHVCVGINGVKDFGRGRDVPVEAFIYSAINRELARGSSPLWAEFVQVLREINRMALSSDTTTRVARAQGAMWARMAQSALLREALLREFRERRAALPFEIADGSLTVADTLLDGSFRWVAVNEQPAPAEFPAGSGAMLTAGSLDLRDLAAARASHGGRFTLAFTLRPASDTARATGESGRFRVVADSLHFTPAGREGQPPVRFRYLWRPNAELVLVDSRGHAWTYIRKP